MVNNMYVIKINNKYYWCTAPRPFSLDIRRAVVYKTVKQAEAVVKDLSGRMRYICCTKYNNNTLPDDMQDQTEFSVQIIQVDLHEVEHATEAKKIY